MYIFYCEVGNFRENFIFKNSVNRHISHFKNLRLGNDLPTSVNDRVIAPFCQGFFISKVLHNLNPLDISKLAVCNISPPNRN